MKLSKTTRVLILTLIVLLAATFWLNQNGYFDQAPTTFEPPYPSVNANGDPFLGVFEGRTPCTDCNESEKVKVALVLYQNPETKAPSTYWLGRVLVGKGNDLIVTQGTWTIRHGIKGYPEAVVYQLDSNTPEGLRSYWLVNENILLPLDQNMNLKVGNASWGYMLSRTH